MEVDYLVIGGGSAGCVLAARLSEDFSRQVALVEAGGTDDQWVVRTPAALVAMLPTKLNNWGFQTTVQAGLAGRRGYQPRGRVLGGSSSTNAMVYLRGDPEDYDQWAAEGNCGWSFNDVLPYFRKSEHNERFDDDRHGKGGPLNVADSRTGNRITEMFVQAGINAGLPRVDDFNGPSPEGIGIYQLTQKNGERWNTARAYLDPARSRPNLAILTRSRALRLTLENRRVTGAVIRRNGADMHIKARAGVVLAAGAFQSPHLLMLSGIGPGQHLKDAGIPALHNLPGVGGNLQDHVDYIFSFRATHPDLVGTTPSATKRIMQELFRYRRNRMGMWTSNYAEGGALFRRNDASPRPDFQLHFVVAIVENHARRIRLGQGFSCHLCLLHPKSRGTVRLGGPDPLSDPVIDPNFYDDPRDLDAMVDGFRLTRRILDADPLRRVRGAALHGELLEEDADIREELRQRSDTIYHPVGTCRMGTDADAVVDPHLRVHGIDGLWVADASIMPTIIGGNTNAPTVMIAEKAADMIRRV